MALRTRVWSAGKLVLLVGALRRHVRGLCLDRDARGGAGPRRHGAGSRRPSSARGDRARASARPHRARGRGAAAGSQSARRCSARPGSTARVELARRMRSVRVWVSAGPRIVQVPRLIGESERAAQIRLSRRAFAGDGGRDPHLRLCRPMSSSRRTRRRATRRRSAPAGQSRRGPRQLRHAGTDRRQRRPRRRRCCGARLPRQHRRRSNPHRASRPASCCGRRPQADTRSSPGDSITLEVSR